MKIAMVGSHGVGKTTLCFEIAARLKRRNLDVELVREVARRCPLPINQETTIAAQEWILHTQMALELEATACHEVVLCDRSALDNYCYLVQAAGSNQMWERILDRWLPTYDLLVYVPVVGQPSFDGVRATDPSFQGAIEMLLDGMMEARGLTPLRLDREDRPGWGRTVLEQLLPRLEPTPPLFDLDELEL